MSPFGDGEDNREELQQELTQSKERLTEAYNQLFKLLPLWEGESIEEVLRVRMEELGPKHNEAEFPVVLVDPAMEAMKCQKVIKEIQEELYYILDIIDHLFWGLHKSINDEG